MSKLEIGVLVGLGGAEEEMKKVADLGLRCCQVCSWNPSSWTDDVGRQLTAARKKHGVKVSTFWAGYTGPCAWNFSQGPGTIGLVPPEHREHRVAELKAAGDFAAKFKLPSITTHVGFLPEDPADAKYAGAVEAIAEVARHCDSLGVGFLFETGQETPVTLLRTIERIGLKNLGINLDTANLILYGKGNPVDALDVFGRYVRDLHVKDGLFPTDGEHLGREVPVGEGKVDFPAVITRLKALGYTGPLTIEREISGTQQIADIKQAIAFLKKLI